MSGRGTRAVLPPAEHARPEVRSVDGLEVYHYNRRGQVKVYDFATLPVAEPMQQSLAALFAARCVPHRWGAHATSRQYWWSLQQFAQTLAAFEHPPADVDELTATQIRRWRLSLGTGSGGYHHHCSVTGLLRDDQRCRSGPLADELARRIAEPKSKVQSYSQADFDQIKTAAGRAFRSALLRIRHNAAILEQWQASALAEDSAEYAVGEALDILARTGDLPRYSGTTYRMVTKHYRRVLGRKPEQTWQRLFLTRHEATSLGILLMSTFGWNLSVIDTAEVPQASPDQGPDGHPVYRIPVEKHRRGPRQHFETRNVADDGAASKGRLITEALEATFFARSLAEQFAPGTNRLVAWRTGTLGTAAAADADRLPPVGPIHFGLSYVDGREWGRKNGLSGSPFQRGRRTVLVVDKREPAQHSQDTHDRAYALVDARVQASAGQVIADGAAEAAARARAVVLAAQLVDAPVPDDVPTAIADCQDLDRGPVPSPDGCAASFLMCLGCANAHIHPGHHPRLALLHNVLGDLRSALTPAVWDTDWADAHARLDDLKGKVGAAAWSDAADRTTDADRETVGFLLTGDLDS